MVKAILKQMYVVLGVLIAIMQIGMSVGFTTCLISALQDPTSDIKADLETSSWVATSFTLAWIPGFLSSSYYMNRFGRKVAFILDIIPGAVGLLIMYKASNIYDLIAARALEGITTGSITLLGGIIIGEYTDPMHRGMFLNLKTAALYLGSAITHLLSSYFSWRTLALINLTPYIFRVGIIMKVLLGLLLLEILEKAKKASTGSDLRIIGPRQN